MVMAQNQKLVFTVVVVLHKKKAMIMICSWRTNLNIIRLTKKVHLVLSKIKGMFFIFTKKFIEQHIHCFVPIPPEVSGNFIISSSPDFLFF